MYIYIHTHTRTHTHAYTHTLRHAKTSRALSPYNRSLCHEPHPSADIPLLACRCKRHTKTHEETHKKCIVVGTGREISERARARARESERASERLRTCASELARERGKGELARERGKRERQPVSDIGSCQKGDKHNTALAQKSD